VPLQMRHYGTVDTFLPFATDIFVICEGVVYSLGGAGVSPAVFWWRVVAENRRRDARATKLTNCGEVSATTDVGGRCVLKATTGQVRRARKLRSGLPIRLTMLVKSSWGNLLEAIAGG